MYIKKKKSYYKYLSIKLLHMKKLFKKQIFMNKGILETIFKKLKNLIAC